MCFAYVSCTLSCMYRHISSPTIISINILQCSVNLSPKHHHPKVYPLLSSQTLQWCKWCQTDSNGSVSLSQKHFETKKKKTVHRFIESMRCVFPKSAVYCSVSSASSVESPCTLSRIRLFAPIAMPTASQHVRPRQPPVHRPSSEYGRMPPKNP